MDQQLRQLERQALDDPEARQRLNIHLCRVKGHQFTEFSRFENPITKNFVEVRVCWRCHNTEIQADQNKEAHLPSIVSCHNSHLHGSLIHGVMRAKLKRGDHKAIVRGNPNVVVFKDRIMALRLTTVCGKVKVNWLGSEDKMVYDNDITCPRCLENKNTMKQAQRNVESIMEAAHQFLTEKYKRISRMSQPKYYMTPLKSGCDD